MLISDFDYSLPNELIARFPAEERRGSRLLALADESDGLADLKFADFCRVLRAGDLLVFNDTRVIKARLAARKESGGRAEILIERLADDRRVVAHIRASKSPRTGSKLICEQGVVASVVGRDGGLYALDFSVDVLPFLEEHGEVPLPPYLARDADSGDVERYQTIYAKDPGAVAAPTAGLHFDAAMLDETLQNGVQHAWVTLHVGAGTFQSLRQSNIRDNKLHSERIDVDRACCEKVEKTRAAGGRIIAVGTTSVRALESASAGGTLRPSSGDTDIFIVPGYKFRCVDAMLTNFHLPQSSLLMLVAAFAGKDRIMKAYQHAIREKYRFFSYGDAMFLTPEKIR